MLNNILNIITPTYSGHFKYISKYLKSACKYIIDPENVNIFFTISAKELYEFGGIIEPYTTKLHIKVIIFEDVLSAYSICATPEQLLERYGRFSFQTLKKIYSILYTKSKHTLILDSESMWIAPARMGDLCASYFCNPFITCSTPNTYFTSVFLRNVIKNTNYVLNSPKCNKWFLENFMWFYDLEILENLVEEYGTPVFMAENVYQWTKFDKERPGIFEIELYHQYLYLNADRYGYRVIDANEECAVSLEPGHNYHYHELYYKYFCGSNGLLEHAMLFLDKSNWRELADIFKRNHFTIIRCESSRRNYRFQKKFVKRVEPCILAASQNHTFGLKRKYFYIRFVPLIHLSRMRAAIKKLYYEVSPIYRQAWAIRRKLDGLGSCLETSKKNIESGKKNSTTDIITIDSIMKELEKLKSTQIINIENINLFTDIDSEIPFCHKLDVKQIRTLNPDTEYVLIAYNDVTMGERVINELQMRKIKYSVISARRCEDDFRSLCLCNTAFMKEPLGRLDLLKKYNIDVQALDNAIQLGKDYLEIGLWDEKKINFLVQYASSYHKKCKIIFYDVLKKKGLVCNVAEGLNAEKTVFYELPFLQSVHGSMKIVDSFKTLEQVVQNEFVFLIDCKDEMVLRRILKGIGKTQDKISVIIIKSYANYDCVGQVKFVIDEYLEEYRQTYSVFILEDGGIMLSKQGAVKYV